MMAFKGCLRIGCGSIVPALVSVDTPRILSVAFRGYCDSGESNMPLLPLFAKRLGLSVPLLCQSCPEFPSTPEGKCLMFKD